LIFISFVAVKKILLNIFFDLSSPSLFVKSGRRPDEIAKASEFQQNWEEAKRRFREKMASHQKIELDIDDE